MNNLDLVTEELNKQYQLLAESDAACYKTEGNAYSENLHEFYKHLYIIEGFESALILLGYKVNVSETGKRTVAPRKS